MSRRRSTLPLLVLALLLTAAGCGGDGDDGPAASATTVQPAGSDSGRTLTGSVGPGFEISVAGADGLSPGSYTLLVDDKASIHNFHLKGPGGIDVATGVGEEGEQSFKLDLVPGKYTFVCDPHASQMNGTFTVG